jgi:hypothetical protein
MVTKLCKSPQTKTKKAAPPSRRLRMLEARIYKNLEPLFGLDNEEVFSCDGVCTKDCDKFKICDFKRALSELIIDHHKGIRSEMKKNNATKSKLNNRANSTKETT